MSWKTLPVMGLLIISTLLAGLSVDAHDGDLLRNASNQIQWPYNPCQAQGAEGLAGGVAVDEANGRLYYSLASDNKIFRTSTMAPFGCLAVATAPTPAGVGFTRMAFDPFHNGAAGILWAAVADQSGTVLGLDPTTWAIVAQFTHGPGAGRDVVGLAVEEVAPYRIHAVWSGDLVAQRYAATGAAAGTVTLQAVIGDVVSLSGWDDDLLVGDTTRWIRHHELDGSASPRNYRPHQDYTDEFFQPAANTYWSHTDTALDQVTYASLGDAGLFTMNQVAYNTCVSGCPIWTCAEYGPEGCIRYEQTCPPGGCNPVYELRQFPRLQAYRVQMCPDGPSDDCVVDPPCDPEPLGIARLAPQDNVYVRNTDTGTSVAEPLAIQSRLPLHLEDPSGHANKQWQVTGPVPGLPVTVSGGPLDTELNTHLLLPGTYTITIRLMHLTSPCTPEDTLQIHFRVADPHLESRAQNIRVEGNLPVDLVAGTILQAPFDHLIGREQLNVLTGHVNMLADPTDARVLDALAEHAPLAGSEWIGAAHADTDAVDLSQLDLRGLCLTYVSAAACNQLPGPTSAHVLHTQADAQIDAVTGTPVLVTSLVELANAAGRTVDECDQTSATFNFGPPPPLPPVNVSQSCPQIITGPGFTAYINEDWTRAGQGYAEAYANIIRIEIDQHPFRGRIIIGEAYAAASIVGTAVLHGVPQGLNIQDDFDTNGDAPASFGPVLAPGVYSAQFQDQDRNDAFQVNAVPGQKLRVELSPSHRVQAETATLPTPPANQVTPRLMKMELRDASGIVRDSTQVGFPSLADARATAVELNVDGPGPWRIEIVRLDNGVGRAPYTVNVDVSALNLLPGDGLPPAGDVSDACPSATTAQVIQVGLLDQNDPADVYRFTAGGPRTIVELTMPDADGADFDLFILDAACNLVAQSTAGKGPLEVKGAPESYVGSTSGAYHAVVQRVNGIGNYELTVRNTST